MPRFWSYVYVCDGMGNGSATRVSCGRSLSQRHYSCAMNAHDANTDIFCVCVVHVELHFLLFVAHWCAVVSTIQCYGVCIWHVCLCCRTRATIKTGHPPVSFSAFMRTIRYNSMRDAAVTPPMKTFEKSKSLR
jgi:hypothetical protein